MLDLPDVVDAETVGELDLLERLRDQAPLGVRVPRTGELELVEQAESHRGRRIEGLGSLCDCPYRVPILFVNRFLMFVSYSVCRY